MTRRTRIALIALLLLGGCRQDMTRQPKLATYGRAAAFPHNAEARPLPQGAVPRGTGAREQALNAPPPVTKDLVARGRERYDIFCSPCHGLSGHGDGMIVERGFPAPPSYHVRRLVAAPARHFVDVITHGHGVMYPYAARIAEPDRWAITAYVRALQLSQGGNAESAGGSR